MSVTINAAQMTRFCKAKGIDGCHVCGNKAITVHDESSGSRYVTWCMAFPNFDLQTAKLGEMVTSWCNDCGAMQSFHRPIIVDWLTANP
jgi:hypothetical protein